MADDDRLLVQRVTQGDADAVQDLVDRYQGDVYGLCMRMLHHRQDAEDVAQEVFLRVFRSLHKWDSSRPFKPWVITIAVNRCRTFLTQRARRPELVEYLHETVMSRDEDDGGELLKEIHTALADMRWEYKSAFVLFHEQGEPYEVIAEALERPVGTIKTWLHRARMQLLTHLKKRGMVPEVNHEMS